MKKCILLVDDNRMDIELTLEAFSTLGLDVRVEVANGGQEAIDYMLGAGERSDRSRFPIPDVVLLDLNMPRIDGFSVLREIRSSPLVKTIPVVIMTSSQEDRDLYNSYSIGANSFVPKPVSLERFFEVVSLLERYWLDINRAIKPREPSDEY